MTATATCITLPDVKTTELDVILTFRRRLSDLAWTGNQGIGKFTFCFKSAADRRKAERRLKSITTK